MTQLSARKNHLLAFLLLLCDIQLLWCIDAVWTSEQVLKLDMYTTHNQRFHTAFTPLAGTSS